MVKYLRICTGHHLTFQKYIYIYIYLNYTYRMHIFIRKILLIYTHSDQNYPVTLVFQNYANHHILI
jgi:hypothetical protein